MSYKLQHNEKTPKRRGLKSQTNKKSKYKIYFKHERHYSQTFFFSFSFMRRNKFKINGLLVWRIYRLFNAFSRIFGCILVDPDKNVCLNAHAQNKSALPILAVLRYFGKTF